MKSILCIFALVLASAVADRFVVAGNDATFGNFAWIFSLKFAPGQAPAGQNNTVFGMVMGKMINNMGSPPYVSVVFAQGKESLDTAGKQFQGAATGAMITYHALAEYCETNGVPGYQAGADTAIQTSFYNNLFWHKVFSGINGNVYWAIMNDTTGVFTLSCRISAASRVDGGITVDPLSMKCDITINSNNFWSQATTVTCPDDKRFIALIALVGGFAVDNANGLYNQPDLTGQSALTIDNAKSFFKWKTTFTNMGAGSAITFAVDSQLVPRIYSANTPVEVTDLRQAVFSFLSPKGVGGGIFFWDPQIGVNPKVENASSVQCISVLLVTLALIFVML